MILHYENVDGTCGRVARFRKDLYENQCYGEESHPAGGQDVGLLKRLQELPKCKYQKLDLPSSHAIPNTKEETVVACDPSICLTWREMSTENRRVFWERRQLSETSIREEFESAWRMQIMQIRNRSQSSTLVYQCEPRISRFRERFLKPRLAPKVGLRGCIGF